MPNLTQHADPPPQGTQRYYFAEDGPVRYAALAYTADGPGDVAAFVISGLPTAQTEPGAAGGAANVAEAARANLALAAEFCVTPGIPAQQRAQMFRQAGFTETIERSISNSDTTHNFRAPAGTAAATLYYGEMPVECSASSTAIGVTEASAILDALVPRLYPGYVRNVTQGAAGETCVRYEQPNSPIPHVIGVGVAGGGQGCVNDGTARIFDVTLV